ncbi:28S ribosomal protein S25, mitochondrial [Balamuthia mandrillaris]
MAWRGKMKQFGKFKGLPKPKTTEDWLKVYMGHQHYLFGVSRVQLEWAKKGAGQTGARYFKYNKLPPLRFWNPDVEFVEIKRLQGKPSLIVDYEDGRRKEWDLTGKKEEEVFSTLMNGPDAVVADNAKASSPSPAASSPSLSEDQTTTTAPSEQTASA